MYRPLDSAGPQVPTNGYQPPGLTEKGLQHFRNMETVWLQSRSAWTNPTIRGGYVSIRTFPGIVSMVGFFTVQVGGKVKWEANEPKIHAAERTSRRQLYSRLHE